MRALESYVGKNPKSANAHFVLAYHYLIMGHQKEAATELEEVQKLLPNEVVSAQLLQMMGKSAAATPAVESDIKIDAGNLVGTWHATRGAKAAFELTLTKDKAFTWVYREGKKKEEVKGAYALEGNVLALEPDAGGVMLAEITATSRRLICIPHRRHCEKRSRFDIQGEVTRLTPPLCITMVRKGTAMIHVRSLVASLTPVALAPHCVGCSNEPPLAQTPPVEVVVAQAVPPGKEPDTIRDWDVYTGTVFAKESIEVKARVKGHVIDVPFKEGEEIAAGTVLFLLDAEPFKADLKRAQGDLTTWEAKLKFADEQITLYKPLAEKGTVSEEDLLKAISAKDEAIGGVGKAKAAIRDAELNIEYCKITAPIDGRVGEALLSKGDLVNSSGADSLLTTIVAVDPMYVNFNVNERTYGRYRGDPAGKSEKGSARDQRGETQDSRAIGRRRRPFSKNSLTGFVDFVDNRVDPATGSIKVRAA